MKAAIDTSVLVSALHRAHPHHEDARAWLEAAMRNDAIAFVTTHALAETWSVLSRIPGPNGGSGNSAATIPETLRSSVVS